MSESAAGRGHTTQAPVRDGNADPGGEVPEVLAIVGPTAAGKSRLAMQLARRRRDGTGRDVELVAVDSFTIYRGMDVGTAKPSGADRAEVAHHCIDLLDPDQEVSVAWFQTVAREAIAGILERGRTPLLVGGSGLYFRAVVDDLSFPPTDPEVRDEIRVRWEDDPEGAHEQLRGLDPDAAAKIQPENLRRTVRALEVIELTDEPFSAYDDSWDDYRSIYPGLRVAYLEPDAEQLRQRIRERTERMLAGGLLEEARRLRDGQLSNTARQGIGYREAFAVLDGQLGTDEFVEKVSQRTWRYARRQRSWFRADPRCEPVDPAVVLEQWAVTGPAGGGAQARMRSGGR